MKTVEQFNDLRVPCWALSYLVNGDASGLTTIEEQMVDRWFGQFTGFARRYPGHIAQFVCGDSEPSFTRFTEFGMACECVDCSVLILAPEEVAA